MSKRANHSVRRGLVQAIFGSIVGISTLACVGSAGPGSGDEGAAFSTLDGVSGVASLTGAPSPVDVRTKGVACASAPGGACAVGERCCRAPATGASVCVARGAACPTARAKDWECTGSADCAAGSVCCGRGDLSAVAGKVAVHHFHGTHCAAACGAGEVTACAGNGECAGRACTATTACGMPLGVCR